MRDNLLDYEIIDGFEGVEDALDYYLALQRQINTGLVWRMQGSIGRSAMDAIRSGRCMTQAGRVVTDYWGNPIPPREAIASGNPGSRDWVVENMGEDWARAMEEADA